MNRVAVISHVLLRGRERGDLHERRRREVAGEELLARLPDLLVPLDVGD